MSAISIAPQPEVSTSDAPHTIAIEVVTTANPDADQPYRLKFPRNRLFYRVPWNYVGAMEWVIGNVPAGVKATFDNPAITFLTNPEVMRPSHVDPKTLSLPWTNIDGNIGPLGRSFNYRLHVLVKDATGEYSISHDPTVHNEPPATNG